MRLTDMSIKALPAPVKGVTVYFDEVLSGFGVRVSQAGTKSFVLTHGPRRTRETIGRVGVIGLHDARQEAKRRLAEITLGRNRPVTVTWDEAKQEFLDEREPDLKPRTHQDYSYILGRHFRYGPTKLCELAPADLRRNIERLSKTPAEQQHAFVVVRAFLRWAHRKHYLDANPLERMQAPHSYEARERVLTNEELKNIWHACGEDTFGRIVKLLILTGQRRGEIAGLTGAMVANSAITFPSTHTKNSKVHSFPLGCAAKALLEPRVSTNALFFPALGKNSPFNGWSKSKFNLDKRSGVYGWQLHDLRRTFASGLASIAVPIPVIERLLNHISGSFAGIVGVYQRYDYFPEMQDAISRWETHVQSLVQ